jgi:hypothetical protein
LQLTHFAALAQKAATRKLNSLKRHVLLNQTRPADFREAIYEKMQIPHPEYP